MDIPRLLARWRADPTIGGNVVHWHTQPAQPARLAEFPAYIHPALKQAMSSAGIHQLYEHQRQAWDALQANQHVAIATGTASGKSLCYQLPILNRLLSTPNSRSLLLYPTKALAQDQLSSIQALAERLEQNTEAEVRAAVYDGDTPGSQRTGIRQNARLLLSNPDMLHTGILPHHTRWAEFFQHLDYVIIDEMHTYRGVFGSHVANIIRRLKRIAEFYGRQPLFVLTSATIGNPGQLAVGLVEAPVQLIQTDASPRGERHFLLYNPPLVNPELGLRASMLQESVRLSEELYAAGAQAIVFGRTRRSVEVMLRYLRAVLDLVGETGGTSIRAYRSGYLPRQRRAIEQG
ncbi:MAG: DEAD/DEAH box helicase, partial [Anaerolineales bacterium]|nr:DEAD/DEAH box helicase [Anaerolineales bacterium]